MVHFIEAIHAWPIVGPKRPQIYFQMLSYFWRFLYSLIDDKHVFLIWF